MNEEADQKLEMLSSLEVFAHLVTSSSCKRFLLAHYAVEMSKLMSERLATIVQFTIDEAVKGAAVKCIGGLIVDSEEAQSCYSTLTSSRITHAKLFDAMLRIAKQPG